MTLLFRAVASPAERIASVAFMGLVILGGYGFFVSFLPANGYVPIAVFVAVVLGFLAVLPFVLWWGLNSRIKGKVAKVSGYIVLFIFLSFLANFASMYSGPYIVTLAIGESYQEKATISRKDTNRRGCAKEIALREYSSKLCVSAAEWKYLNIGDTVTLNGIRSIFGFSVENVTTNSHQS